MTLKTLVAAAAFAVTGAIAADALTVQWSVDVNNGGVDAPGYDSGTLAGFFEAEETSATLLTISNIYNITFDGAVAPDLDFVFSLASSFVGAIGGVGTINLASETIDLLACTTALCDGDAFGFALYYGDGAIQFLASTPEYGLDSSSDFSNLQYAILPAVPLPAGGLLLLSGVAGFAGLKRRKKLAAV